MAKSAISMAEAKFAATQKKDKQVIKAKEKARIERAEQTAKLRDLRLAKEAAEREAAEKEAAEKAAAKTAKKTTARKK